MGMRILTAADPKKEVLPVQGRNVHLGMQHLTRGPGVS